MSGKTGLRQASLQPFASPPKGGSASEATGPPLELRAFVGRQVQKERSSTAGKEPRVVRGVVQRCEFLVEYEDGGSEHVTLEQLLGMLVATPAGTAAAAAAAGARKRKSDAGSEGSKRSRRSQRGQQQGGAEPGGSLTVATSEQLLDPLSRCPSATAPASLEPAAGEGGAGPNGGGGDAGPGGPLRTRNAAAAAAAKGEAAGKKAENAAQRKKTPPVAAGAASNVGKAAAEDAKPKEGRPKASEKGGTSHGGSAESSKAAAARGGKAAKPAPEGKGSGAAGKPKQKAPAAAVAAAAGAAKGKGKLKKEEGEAAESSAEADKPAVGERECMEYAPGAEPWRAYESFSVPVHLEPNLSNEAKKGVAKCKEAYYRLFRKAEVEEEERVSKARAEIEARAEAARRTRKTPKPEKMPSKRPDRVTESWMKAQGQAIYQEKLCGYVPGIAVGDGFYSRAELSVCGMHGPPVAGIYYVSQRAAGKGVPSFAVSVVQAGWYEDDHDDGEEIIYTGEGGNDLLGTRKQTGEQKLLRGNLALVGNIVLGLPVRVIRKNREPNAPYGCVLIFDGLYDVVEYWSESGMGGFKIFRYRLVRRPGQGTLNTHKVTWGTVSAPKALTAHNRPGVVDLDISGGQERLPVWAVNDTEDGEVPAFFELGRLPQKKDLIHAHLGISDARVEELRRSGWRPAAEYVTQYVLAPGVPAPPAPALPREYEGRPHDYIKELNGGRLPYHQNNPSRPPFLVDTRPIVYECSPWCKCPLGKDCPQAVSQRGLRFRLEVYRRTDGQGWAVRTLDMIPQWSFICMYYGEVFPAKEYERLIDEEDWDAAYSTDLLPRPEGDDSAATQPQQQAKYVVCGLRKRNIGGLLNHSCDPNVFVQPVLSEHHCKEMPGIAMFASKDIAPFSDLAWDYGNHDVIQHYENGCQCGAADCISKQQHQQQQ